MKRLFDVTVSLVALILLGWAIVVLAVLVRASSPGPGIFAQTRVGRGETPFRCYKLRTMQLGTVEAASHDTPAAAVTPLGQKLRRWKLDELPQLVNVLRGEMSFVGPRPCLPVQAVLIAERRQKGVYAVRPGITGLAQVQGIDMSDPVRLAAIDADYVRNQSFPGDLGLILKTVVGGGQGDRVRH
ncbi:sugar transferase [Aureimonas sp. SA4125]|uniref:sugar transferase n=1 Tax=Aureimonas sp. SA4125 TaxID=2826993 RepID=UPI001CC6DBDC|nr:sugar transferase [Aureimonas sp. SA4125]BDA83422.1 sugar transferase [Aureimonas sp. SA4125]